MTTANIITTILTMIAGLSVFMFGLKTMSERIEKQAGSKLRKIFAKATDNKLMGTGIGAGVTAIIQSSSATTVMVVGFVNAGILSLTQAATIIMGANIGTTVTALIISLPITEFVAASGLIGVFMLMFSSKAHTKNLGYIIIGLAMIFTGLSVMGSSMKVFSTLESIRTFFTSTTNPFLLVLFGTLVTALIQSSSATTGILITLASAGLMGIDNAIFVILGINIGTCITAIIAAIGANVNAKRTAAIHLMFNLAGTILFALVLSFSPVRNGIINSLSIIGSHLPNEGIGAQIAAFHIFFNVTTTLILLPFVSILVHMSIKLVKDKKDFKPEHELKHLNTLILESPSLAVAQAKKEIIRMALKAKANLDLAIKAVINANLNDEYEFNKRERYIDWLNREIPIYLTEISTKNISYQDEKIIASFYHVVSDIERIGDYAENIFEYTEKLIEDNNTFSKQAVRETKEMYSVIEKLFNRAIYGFEFFDLSILNEVESLEDQVDEFKLVLSEKHIRRLGEGTCSAQAGAMFLSLVSNLERIADHMRNIFNSIRTHTKSKRSVSTIVYKKN